MGSCGSSRFSSSTSGLSGLSSSAVAASSNSANVKEAAARSISKSFRSSVVEERVTFPVSVVTSSAFRIKAATTLDTSLKAVDTPIATETPAPPATDAAIEVAPTPDNILDESLAVRVMLSACTPVAPSPSMAAVTVTAMRFTALAPAPLKANPAPTPPVTAAEPAKTTASMF